MNLPTSIENDAPVRARDEIDINAPFETVWRQQTEVWSFSSDHATGMPDR
jgi:hypothetical protein